MTAFSNTRQDFPEHVRSFRNVPGISITYQVFGAHILMLGTPLTLSIKVICKYRNHVIICRKWSIMTVLSNTRQDFREHARSFRNVPGVSITYQVFGAHILMLGTSLTLSIKVTCKYRNHVIICRKWSIINCVHIWQRFLTQDRIFENMPGLSGTYQVFRSHTRCLVHISSC